MSCCGDHPRRSRGDSPMIPRFRARTNGVVYFRYLGNQTMTAIGPVTGRVYRFSSPGAVAAADPRDAPSLAAVPHLTQVNDL
jgi:hypothetical protein